MKILLAYIYEQGGLSNQAIKQILSMEESLVVLSLSSLPNTGGQIVYSLALSACIPWEHRGASFRICKLGGRYIAYYIRKNKLFVYFFVSLASDCRTKA